MIADLQPMAAALVSGTDGEFIVKMRGFALHFHTNVNGKMYSVVKEAEATRFESEEVAHAAIRVWAVPAKYAEVVRL